MTATDPSKIPRIEFKVAEEEIQEQPHLSPVVIKQMIDVLGLKQIAINLKMEKHHGVCIHDIIFVLLLYSTYEVNSIDKLSEKAQKDKLWLNRKLCGVKTRQPELVWRIKSTCYEKCR